MQLRDLAGSCRVEGTASADLEVTGIGIGGLAADSRTGRRLSVRARRAPRPMARAYAADAVGRGAVADRCRHRAAPLPACRCRCCASTIRAGRWRSWRPASIGAQPQTIGRGHRHQRQDLGRRLRPADLGSRPATRPRASARIGVVGRRPQRLRHADHARSGRAAPAARRLAEKASPHAAMEASSHGLDQRRLDGVQLAAAGFTNLGRDHMDYHPTVEDYLAPSCGCSTRSCRRARRRSSSPTMPWSAPTIAGGAGGRARGPDGRPPWRFPRAEAGRARAPSPARRGRGRRRALRDRLPLAGDFQVSNALVAAGLAIATGITGRHGLDCAWRAQGRARPARAGRHHGQRRADLRRLRPQARRAGERAGLAPAVHHGPRHRRVRLRRRPRPRQAAADGRGRDAGSPTSSSSPTTIRARKMPAAIRAAILAGAPGAIEIGDRARRRSARRSPCCDAGDVLCVAGKGHETGQIVGAETLPFSDHEEVARGAREERAA